MSAFLVVAVLALASLAGSLGCMIAFCIEDCNERYLIWAGALLAAGLASGFLANYL